MAGYDNNKLGELRPNQIITTFGPGAIVDAVKDSVTVLDINYWKEKGKKIIDGRLASYLGVDCFYMPRTSYSGDVPVVSFPYIHVCSNLKCGRLFDMRDNFDLDCYLRFGVNCPDCHKPAYPSRFITICENGHMDDFPWSWWVHRGATNCKGQLRMYSTGNTSTLADMWVECKLCGAKRSMSGATQGDNFSDLHCMGHHPFRPRSRNERCDKKVIPSQRGASNVYFSVSRSAISIPPWVNPLYNLIDEHLHDIELLKDVMGDDGITAAYKKYFAERYSREEFDEALTRRLSNITEFKEIKQMEYDAITHHNDPAYASNKKHFKAEEDSLPEYLKPYFSRIIRITRLREVKVLLGFTRVDAPDPDADAQTNIVYLNKGKTEKWLPAAEVNGEGVFIEFNKAALSRWLDIPSVKALSQRYEECYEEFCVSKGWTLNIKRNAIYVLMHTFAHLLIKQMSMASGYAKHGYADKEDCKWSATTIIRILQDETYIGTLVQGKQGSPHYKIKQMEQRPSSEWIRVPDAHEPLIAKQDFELVQRIRRLDTRTSPKRDTVYLFSGVLICGCCGSRMTRKTNRVKGKEYHYYYCPTGKKHGCTNPVMLKESDLVECVKDSLKGYIDNVSCLQAILDGIDQSSINQALANEYASHIAANEQQVEQALEFKARLYESLITGTISKEEYTDYKARYTRIAENAKESIRVLKEKLADVLENRSERNRWISHFTQFSTMETLDRKAVVHMIQSIKVIGKKELEITFTYQDEYQKAIQLIQLAEQTSQRKVG